MLKQWNIKPSNFGITGSGGFGVSTLSLELALTNTKLLICSPTKEHEFLNNDLILNLPPERGSLLKEIEKRDKTKLTFIPPITRAERRKVKRKK